MLTPKEYVQSGDHLPPFLRDFHDAKDFFKAMHAIQGEVNPRGGCSDKLSWVGGHIYTIDYLLWFLAQRGWTLQRSRKRVAFKDLDAEIQAYKAEASSVFRQMLADRRKEQADGQREPPAAEAAPPAGADTPGPA